MKKGKSKNGLLQFVREDGGRLAFRGADATK